MSATIRRIHARQILDSRGTPTVQVDLELDGGAVGSAAVPSGASTGSHEAVELRDGGAAWSGKGVMGAVGNVNGAIATELVGTTVESHADVDRRLVALDGTANRGRLGANAVLGVSLALARALAAAESMPVWRWMQGAYALERPACLPVPMLNVLNGGEHANNGLDVQEFMVVPHGFATFSEALEAAVGIFHRLKRTLDDRGMSTAVGDEGGFAPRLGSNQEALELLVEAIEAAGHAPGENVSIALDVAATELYRDGAYGFSSDGEGLDADGLLSLYERWAAVAPIISIEDGAAEDDWGAWKTITDGLGDRMQIVGDDLFVTSARRIREGIRRGAANALLVKVNQVGTLRETLEAMHVADGAGFRSVMSHRSGETEDAIIADLAVGTGCGQIKTGAPSRSDRVAKYNRLLQIEEALGGDATYARPFDTLVGAR